MLTPRDLKPHQIDALTFVKNIFATKKHGPKGAALFLDMGMGKTATTLTLVKIMGGKTSALIIAPAAVVDSVWETEPRKWSHLAHMPFAKITSDVKKIPPAKMYLMSMDYLRFFVAKNRMWELMPYNPTLLIIDESTGFKNYKSTRFRCLQKILPHFGYRLILTGTPAPNDYIDLWSQIYILDEGRRLHHTMIEFRSEYCTAHKMTLPHTFTEYKIKPGAREKIQEKIKDIAMTLEQRETEIPRKYIDFTLEPYEEDTYTYRKLMKEKIINLPNETVVGATNHAHAICMAIQLSSGFVYADDLTSAEKESVAPKLEACRGGEYYQLHNRKIDRLRDITMHCYEQDPRCNFLIAINYTHEERAIIDAFEKDNFSVVALSQYTPQERSIIIDKWNDGKINMLLINPKSGAHGLNLQYGGYVTIWFSLTWNLEHYLQFNSRLNRPGQKHPLVYIIHILHMAIDHEIINRLINKDCTQKELIEFLKKDFESENINNNIK